MSLFNLFIMGEAKRRKELDKSWGEKKENAVVKLLKKDNKSQLKCKLSNFLQIRFDPSPGEEIDFRDFLHNPEWQKEKSASKLLEQLSFYFLENFIEIDRQKMIKNYLAMHEKNVGVAMACVLDRYTIDYSFEHFSEAQNNLLTWCLRFISKRIIEDCNFSLSEERKPFLKQIEKTMAVGKKLHDLGGFDLMLCAYQDFVPPCDRPQLNQVWNGIGTWKS